MNNAVNTNTTFENSIIAVYSPLHILDGMVGTVVNGSVTEEVAKRLIAKTTTNPQPTTSKHWVRIECAFSETGDMSDSPFEVACFTAAAKIAGRKAVEAKAVETKAVETDGCEFPAFWKTASSVKVTANSHFG